ncbi:MAG: aldo/keto reductase [Candidatus Izemoplasmatales bacterium]
MKKKGFASTGKTVGRIGFGGWQLGNQAFWSEMSEQEGIDLVREAISCGVNFFDTAPGYASGQSETIIGKAIAGHREEVVINSKFGHTADGRSDFSIEAIEPSLQESLSRLQTNYLDSLILHNPSWEILSGKTKHAEAFETLKSKGLIHAWGVSIDSKEELRTVLDHLPVDVIEIMFNLFFQGPRAYFDEIQSRGIALVVKVPLDSGWLSGKYNTNSVFTGIRSRWDQKTKATRSKLVGRVLDITHSENLVSTALAFILSYDAVTTVIPGTRTSSQLHANIQAETEKLSPDMIHALEQFFDQEVEKEKLPW